MKITIVSAVYKRPYLWAMFNQSMQDLEAKFQSLGYDTDKYIAATFEDEETYFNKRGWTVVKSSNEYVTRKWNNVIEAAYLSDTDYIFIIGSDDLVDPDLIDIYRPYIKTEHSFFGVEEILFLNYNTNKLKHFRGYVGKERMSLGAGRMIHKRALKIMHGRLARETWSRGFDTSVMVNLRAKGIKEVIVDVDKPYILDIKIDDNLTKWDNINCIEQKANYELLNNQFKTFLK